ncbi:M17 family metallopeptidase [Candidatus Persebacteraceae bacterium Df01]|jgi:leucyl aminopeptidase|uniref:M17 family metallopeptidase n=1 Tax=Candidatus Doriopsillibacter californiensis TaxID=2970740 RepID=A0ABT7QMU8_9GAMM|nr:M17 family metallopeptidase [Candidatus Persebacteraceae bacterium Df01]
MSILSQLGDTPVWRVRRAVLAENEYRRYDAVLQIINDKSSAPFAGLFNAVAKKRGHDKGLPPLTLEDGTAIVRLLWSEQDSVFEQLECLRKLLTPLLAKSVAVDIRVMSAAYSAIYATLIAASDLPGDKGKCRRLMFAGCAQQTANIAVVAAAANTLARGLCRLPPNVLTVPAFARSAITLARRHGVRTQLIDHKKLKTLKAGAILAVGRASVAPPCVVRLSYTVKNAPRVALVGKGVCYDSGGVNVKPARYMRGMKGDMAGAAVALAAVLAAAQNRLPVSVEAFLVLADNGIGPAAYCPDEVVTAMNGKRIEIVHSDAEGRMLLADTLTLATRVKPAFDAVVSFATLTGTMVTALGTRMSGAFAVDDGWRQRAVEAATASGERLCVFPLPTDYKDKLKSNIADIKQCAEEGDADHILAALFLREFIEGTPPWLHLDLSASSCKGGLGAAPGPETGFGAAWTFELLRQLANKKSKAL